MKDYKPFEEAREFVRELGLKGQKEWYQYCKSGKKPDDIPRNAHHVYKNKGWKGYGDWLGTGRAATQDMIFKPFEEAREFVRKLGLKNVEEWYQYRKSGKRPSDIPSDPYRVYKNKGWKGWGDWLGNEFKLFEEAREFVRKLGLKNVEEWYQYRKSDKRPSDIPSAPEAVYKDKGWISWGDWLGTGRIASYDIIFKPFEEAREFVRRLGLRSKKKWELYCKSGKKPDDIPRNAHHVYKNKGWKGYGDWLGTGRKQKVTKPCLFEEWCYTVRKMNVKSAKDYRKRHKAREFPDNFPSAPQKIYAKKLKKKKQLIFS